MQYRSFPKLPQLPVSTLGFGCMRLPVLGGDPGRIDEEKATALLHAALDQGVNYVDTAWPYHGGQSEPFVGRALGSERRKQVHLAPKCPVWLVESEADWDRYLDQQLERLRTDHIDFYMLHALAADRWEAVRRFGGLQAFERARADGRIRHLGFSFHASLDVFKEVVDGYDGWEFCQLQLNYLDEEYQAGVAGMRYAAARGIGTIVMEPLRGGALANTPPALAEIWGRSERRWSSAEWALRWVWSHPEVVTALSGMNEPSQLEENLRVAGSAAPLCPSDLARFDEAKQVYRARMRVPCTTCGYCQPCPAGVAIPDVLSQYNSAAMFGSKSGPAAAYRLFVLGNGAGADQCTKCRECEAKCPQGISIASEIEEAHACLTSP